MLRRYRASSSYLPLAAIGPNAAALRRYRASSSYLPECLRHYRTYVLRRYRASSSYLPLAAIGPNAAALRRYRAKSSYLPSIQQEDARFALRRYRSSSSYLPGYVPLERSICFGGTALLAVTYLELISAGVREGFVGSALRAATCPSILARFSPASFVGIAFLALASRCQENQKALVGPEKKTRQASPYPPLAFVESCAS